MSVKTLLVYDDADRVVTVTHPSDEVVTTTYNPARQSITLFTGGQGLVTSATYNALGQPRTVNFGNGVQTQYTYFGLDYQVSGNLNQSYGRVRQICVTANNCALGYYTGTLMNLAYWYDAVGNITTLRDDTLRQRENFAYDPLNRLVSAMPSPLTGVTTTLDYTETHNYTSIGNFISKAGVTQYYSSTKPHAATGLSNGALFQYDANGNMTLRVEVSGSQRITYTQSWDVDNRLIDVMSGTQHTQFFYDADGVLVRKVDARGTTAYVGGDDEITWLVPTQTITTTIPATLTYKLYLPMMAMNTLNAANGVSSTYYRFSSQRVAMRTGVKLYWIHGDSLGSASLVTSITATVVSELRYTPFGEVRWQNGVSVSDHQFAGARFDATNNIVQMGARWYSPLIGRFLSADGVVPRPGDSQAYNRYTYARNSPLVRIDPSGHADCDAGNTQCWIDQYIAKANWYRQNLAFRWLANNHLKEVTKKEVEAFYKNLLDDPDAFIKRFLNVAEFGRSIESTYLMLLTTETTLDYRSPEQLVSAIVEDTKGYSSANAVLYAHQRNQNDPSSDFNVVSLAGVAAPGFGFAIIVVGSNGTLVPIPEGWSAMVAINGKGMVYQRPGAMGNADSIRVMDPTPLHPQGYVRYYNWQGQPLDVNGSQGNPAGGNATHIPLDYEGPMDKWPK